MAGIERPILSDPDSARSVLLSLGLLVFKGAYELFFQVGKQSFAAERTIAKARLRNLAVIVDTTTLDENLIYFELSHLANDLISADQLV